MITSENIRPFVRQILSFDFSDLVVLSYDQLTADINIVHLGMLDWVAAA